MLAEIRMSPQVRTIGLTQSLGSNQDLLRWTSRMYIEGGGREKDESYAVKGCEPKWPHVHAVVQTHVDKYHSNCTLCDTPPLLTSSPPVDTLSPHLLTLLASFRRYASAGRWACHPLTGGNRPIQDRPSKCIKTGAYKHSN
jgi:hypothetical protein